MKGGRFVSFEGIEGCGKTTQIRRLASLLTERGVPHTLTREPGGTQVGDGIRRILLDSATIHLTAASELLLFYASRSQNIEEIIVPALARGDVVLCDRFYDASMAYQGYGRGIDLDLIEKLTDLVCADHRPDLTILLDISPELGLTRARARNARSSVNEERFESEDLAFYGRVRKGYLELARRHPDRIRVVSAEGSVEEVHRSVCAVLDLVGARA